MKERYNILWIDDQHQDLDGFADEAYGEGFDITPFSSSREGMQYLEGNLSSVDALILDAKVFKDGSDDVPSERGLTASIREIARISGKNQGKEIPYVVYTGQPDLEADDDFAGRMDDVLVFSKNQDTKALFDKLRELVGNSPDATVRNQHRATYDACGKGRIDPECWKLLAPVLRSITHVEDLSTDPYNDVRKALEWVFRYLHRNSVIHEKLIDDAGRVNLQGISLFLAGKPAHLHSTNEDLLADHPILPKLLVDSVKFILDVTQPGSHTEKLEDADAGKPSIEAVKEFSPNHHLIQVVAIMAADMAAWAVNYVAAHADADANRQIWDRPAVQVAPDGSAELECEIITEAPGSYFGKPISPATTSGENVRIPKNLTESNLSRGTHVRVAAHKHDIRADHWLATSVELV
jgi:hypothetical protein